MEITAWALVGLLAVYLLSHFAGYILNINDDRFYSPFHFTGGVLTAFFFYGLTNSYALSVAGTMAIGIAWEIYEVLLWKYVYKKRKYKPKKDDTRNDLILDLVGSLTTIFLIARG